MAVDSDNIIFDLVCQIGGIFCHSSSPKLKIFWFHHRTFVVTILTLHAVIVCVESLSWNISPRCSVYTPQNSHDSLPLPVTISSVNLFLPLIFAICKFPVSTHCDETYQDLQPLPSDGHCCHMGTAIKHPVPDRFKSSFVFLTSRHSYAQTWASECPDVKNNNWQINLVW